MSRRKEQGNLSLDDKTAGREYNALPFVPASVVGGDFQLCPTTIEWPWTARMATMTLGFASNLGMSVEYQPKIALAVRVEHVSSAQQSSAKAGQEADIA